MTDPSTVLPDWSATGTGGILRVQGTSRLAFGATTAALVTLASGGTAVLVNTGTSSMSSVSALPSGSLLVDGASASGAVIVDRPVGTLPPAPVVETDRTASVLRAALAQRAQPGRRVLTAPLVPLPSIEKPPVVVVAPVPVVQPRPTPAPVVPAPVVAPASGGVHSPRTPHSPVPTASSTPTKEPTTAPTTAPAVVTQDPTPTHQPRTHGHAKAKPQHHDKADAKPDDKADDKADDKGDRSRAKHARHGKHSR